MLFQQNTAQVLQKPLVSFIVTCYNLPGELLRECLESILNLTLRNYEREIIVVDDGSVTSVLPELNAFANDITYLRKPNGGVSSARNVGMKLASGTYIQFVDGDDMLLQTQYNHILDIARYGNIDLIMFDFTHDSNETEAVSKVSDVKSGTELMSSQNIHGSAWGYLFKKTTVGNLAFTPGIVYGEDEEFTAQLLLRAEAVVTTSAKAYFYRERDDSVIHNQTTRGLLKRLNDAKTVLTKLHGLTDSLPIEERTALERRVHQLTMDYLYNIIVLTQNRHYLDRRIEELTKQNLYPLPDRNYTKKYRWFRTLANTKAGLSMLMRTLPLMKKER